MRENPSAPKTFLIADVRGYTLFTQERGDEAAAALVESFARLTEKTVSAAEGTVVEFRGDEALAVFDSPRAAIRAAVNLQRAYVADPTGRIPVGIGLDVGEAVPVERGFRGAALNLAARLCGIAAAGEVLATTEVVHLAGRIDDVFFEERADVTFKNVSQPVRVVKIASARDDPATVFLGIDDPKERPIRIVLADDSLLFREGVARVLSEAGFVVAGGVGDAVALMPMVDREEPDVVITDIRMPPTHTTEGLRAAQRIRDEHPDVGVLVLSQYVETRHALKLLQDSPEGIGYLLKERVADIEEFVGSVRRVARGGTAIDPEVIASLLRRSERGGIDGLTDREREIIGLMAEGRSNQAICDQLFLSPKTVETHVGSIFSKLGLLPAADGHRRVLAVLTYLREAQ